MSNWIGALIGAVIDRQDGDSGIKGAAIGYATQSAVKIVVPLAVTFAIGWAVQAGIRKAVKSLSGDAEPRAAG